MQTNRKRKQPSSSGPANSTGTGNTVGPSPNSPASTHTPGDGITTASSLQHVSSGQKGLMMYGSETAGLASSANQLVGPSVSHTHTHTHIHSSVYVLVSVRILKSTSSTCLNYQCWVNSQIFTLACFV